MMKKPRGALRLSQYSVAKAGLGPSNALRRRFPLVGRDGRRGINAPLTPSSLEEAP